MKINFVATERHFVDHLVHVWRLIPREVRGRFYMPRTLDAHAHALDIVETCRFFTDKNEAQGEIRSMTSRGERCLIVVSASGNVQYGNRTGNPVVLMQHGAGQSYGSKVNPSYAGYPHHKGVALFLHPGPHPAARDRRVYPGTPVEEIGSPRLDKWHQGLAAGATYPEVESKKPVVALSFHWNARIGVSEAGSQFAYYEQALPRLAEAKEYHVIGHAHPRMWKHARAVYEKLGIECVREFSQVMKRAHLYAVDNSSTLFEFASTGRPVLVLNGPSYRKSVRFGLRFWEAADVGLNVETPRELHEKILEALEDAPAIQGKRAEALAKVYSYQDGKAAERAVDAILGVRKRLIQGNLKTKQLKEVALPKNVYMIAKVTFYNTQHEGRVTRGLGFWTTEARARQLESPVHNLAYRAEPPKAEEEKPAKAKDRKTKVDGPTKRKIDGPDTEKDAKNLVDPDEAVGSGEPAVEPVESWTPPDEMLEQAMKERLGFGEARGGWIPVFIDGAQVHKSQGKEAAKRDGRELLKAILIEEQG